ncbi:MFS transporter [Actinomycetospora endophytica]|uniref:MFS transporter n=1 Tax=Actinomycetospora endophytica TaxID=2291215 RepID=A0ABS8P0N8_9PSEU|nr:MFS transporter [Actinomycetospora endophytica]MCD2191819.1 MFS transporter [Actinomycetospora endophytica]
MTVGTARWMPLVALGAAQFLVVLDTSVMNVSISQLVADFATDVTTIQRVITVYTMIMAAFLLTGGAIGDAMGRRRIFATGLVIYGIGSLLTALAPTVGVLTLGWSIIEGLGGALVLPALAALVGGNYAAGRERALAYGVVGALAGAGIAVGPLLGGWVTTYLSWRLVFAGEVVLVALILVGLRWVDDAPLEGPRPRLDLVGAALSALGIALVVLGVLQSTTWGWLRPRDPSLSLLGFAPTLFVVAAGLVVLTLLRTWVRHREAVGRDPLIRWSLTAVPPLRAALWCLLAQNLVLLGLFFSIPLYLQVVLGLDAFQTGLRLLPISATMLITALAAPRLAGVLAPRQAVRLGFGILFVAILWLLASVEPQLDDVGFAGATALLGIGMGLLAAQLGNIAQSSVGEDDRGAAGGLQYTAQNLGSSLGTAFVGSVLIAALGAAVTRGISDDPRVSADLAGQTGVAISGGLDFVPLAQAEAALTASGVPPDQAVAVVESYAEAQLQALRAGMLAAAAVALASLLATAALPAVTPPREPRNVTTPA